ncbi:hypothetical protein GCM10027345_34600 [Hymenobacter daeguensis]
MLLLPQLAYADALGALGLGQALADMLALVALLFLGLMVVAYWRKAPIMLLVLLGISVFLGLFPTREWLVFGRFNPYAYFCLPLGAWLLGVVQARRAAGELGQLLWLGVAIVGLRQLLGVGAEWSFAQLVAPGQYHLGIVGTVFWLLEIVLGVGSWWLVLRQMRLEGSGQWWQPWWRAPALAAAVGAACTSVFLFLQLLDLDSSNTSISWLGFGVLIVLNLFVGFIAGVLALRLIPRPAAPPAVSGAARRGY